ncbi:MAG: hypothetical protein RLW61_14065 [Gammaproteobacteria bacterium]
MFHSSLRRLASLVLLGALAPAASATIDPRAPLVEALDTLRAADAATRARFVAVAVDALAAQHRATLGSAGADVSWARGTRAYVARLQSIAAAAESGERVLLIHDPHEGLRVIVGRQPARQFVLAPPRPDARAALERDVLERLCLHVDCRRDVAPNFVAGRADGVAAGFRAAAPTSSAADVEVAPSTAMVRTGVPESPPEASPGPVPKPPQAPAVPPPPANADGVVAVLPAGDDGLDCARGDGRHALLLDRACATVVGEVRALAEALHAAARGGHQPDWRVLERGDWIGRGDALVTALDGHRVTVGAPTLARYPALYSAALAWIRARLTGKVLATALAPPAPLVYAAAPAQP